LAPGEDLAVFHCDLGIHLPARLRCAHIQQKSGVGEWQLPPPDNQQGYEGSYLDTDLVIEADSRTRRVSAIESPRSGLRRASGKPEQTQRIPSKSDSNISAPQNSTVRLFGK
jgi:hypothetical protein